VPDADLPEPAAEPRASAEESASVTTAAQIKAVDVDGVGAILSGTIAWSVALVVCLLLRDRLASDGCTWFAWVCLAGVLLGLAGLGYVRRRAAVYRAAAR
jgi:hypothetical protein